MLIKILAGEAIIKDFRQILFNNSGIPLKKCPSFHALRVSRICQRSDLFFLWRFDEVGTFVRRQGFVPVDAGFCKLGD